MLAIRLHRLPIKPCFGDYLCGLVCHCFRKWSFQGNLQALVGQMYDNPQYSSMRDSGFSLFYMFINVGAIFARLPQ